MAHPAQTYDQPDRRAARLFELGLEERTIEEAVIRGLSARQTCTPFHPPSFPGTTQWAETHAAIRQLLAPAGWTPCDRRNYSRVLSPNERIAITVATGDLHTGDLGLFEPATRYPKGPATRDAVEINQQLSLLPLAPAEDLEADEETTIAQTWILLLATDEQELVYELSLPAEQDGEGRVIAWGERIIFPPIEISALPARGSDDADDDDDSDDIDVPIERI